MGLRARVALILGAAIIPISLVFSGWRIASEHRSMTERRIDRAAARMQQLMDSGECGEFDRLREPRRRGRRHRPPRMRFEQPWLYSDALVPYQDAPDFDQDRFGDALDSDEPVHIWAMPGQEMLGHTVIRLAESGDCAIAVIPWGDDQVPDLAVKSAAVQTVGLAAVLALLGMLVAVPIVRRIRRLEDAVRRASNEEFSLDLGGDDEINALADAFEETLRAVRERERVLEEYIANTTHDLAIPITVLQHRLRKLALADDSEDLRVALEESHYIANLIANMRTAAKLESEGVELTHDVDLSEIVERVAQRHGPIAEQKGVDLNFATPGHPVVVQGEPTLTEQALSNLVQNAVQYNDAGGHVSIVLEEVTDGFEIVVADDGPGIPEALRAEVMKRGVRDDEARSRNEGGQGFGLAIVRRVVELHGWSIALEHEGGLSVRIVGEALRFEGSKRDH